MNTHADAGHFSKELVEYLHNNKLKIVADMNVKEDEKGMKFEIYVEEIKNE